MQYRNLKDLAEATGFSRYQIDRAIEAALIAPSWLYKSPVSGRRKIRAEHFDSCVAAMAQWWGKSPEPPPPTVVSLDREYIEGVCQASEDFASAIGAQDGEVLIEHAAAAMIAAGLLLGDKLAPEERDRVLAAVFTLCMVRGQEPWIDLGITRAS